MSKIALAGFGGAIQARQPALIKDTSAVHSVNQKPGRGDLRPWRTPLTVAGGSPLVKDGAKTIYRMGRDMASETQYWLTWTGVVHAIHGFISGDTTERTFYTGDGPPKQTDNTIAFAAMPYPAAWQYLGVPAPTQAMTAAPRNTGVATETEVRYYTYTYVTSRGEESAPAPVSMEVTCKTDDTLTLSGFSPPPSGPYGINRIRVYRTQSGQQGDADFFFLLEITSGTASTIDDGRTLGEVIPTDGWVPPPADLKNLTAMWNGMAAGIVKSDGSVRYCVAYKPYAWPVSYETLPPNARAVALAVFGQRMLVLTNGHPVLVSGSSPDSLDEQPLDFLQPCVASRSAVGMGHGVAWASGDGLCYYGDGGAKVVTTGILTKEQWQLMNPATITGAVYAGTYFGSYLESGSNARRGFFIDVLDPDGIFFLDQGYETMFFDESVGSLFVLDGLNIKKWDSYGTLMAARWRSKIFTGVARNYSAARVEAESYPVTLLIDAMDMTPAAVSTRMAKLPGFFSAPDSTTLRWTKVVTDSKPFRLPSGYVSRHWQVEVQSTSPVQWVMLADSMGDLQEPVQ